MSTVLYTILVERPQAEGDLFGAYCPDVPGCIATGATEAEVVTEMISALEFHLEGMSEDGESPPPATVRAVEVAVRTPVARAA
jgi:predicted RNase H-like HicB family nuclease